MTGSAMIPNGQERTAFDGVETSSRSRCELQVFVGGKRITGIKLELDPAANETDPPALEYFFPAERCSRPLLRR